MSQKVALEVLVDSLLEESSRKFQETIGLKWEWEHYTKIQDLVTKIQEKEHHKDSGNVDAEKVSEETRRENAFPAFKEWLNQHGVKSDKVKIASMGDYGYGLVATQNLKAGDTVFSVSEDIILTSTKVKESKLKLLCDKDPILRSMQNVAIAMFLIFEKYGNNKDSQWSAYINTLPLDYDTVLHFNLEEMSLLKYSPAAFRESLKMIRNVTRQYAYFYSKFKKANDAIGRTFRSILTFGRYAWAVSSVTTRINYLPNPEGEEVMSLIPLWDLCNHDEELSQLSTDFDSTTRTLSCLAAKSFAKGEEFKIYYGHRNSIEYLVHNGFVPPGYRDDTYYLELGVGINDDYTRKKALLGHVNLMCQNIFPVKPERLLSSKGLFMFVRIFLADKGALETMESNPDDLSYLNEPTETSLKFLSTRFMILKRSVDNFKVKVLQALDGSVDRTFLKRGSMILQVLANEQTVLEMLITSTNNMMNQLQR